MYESIPQGTSPEAMVLIAVVPNTQQHFFLLQRTSEYLVKMEDISGSSIIKDYCSLGHGCLNLTCYSGQIGLRNM